jgi:hypothetical protein
MEDNRILSLAFDTHNAASAWEKHQEINVTLWSCLVYNLFLDTGFQHLNVVLHHDYMISSNPADISMYLVSRS